MSGNGHDDSEFRFVDLEHVWKSQFMITAKNLVEFIVVPPKAQPFEP